MDCLHGPNYKGTEPGLLDNKPKGNRTSRLLKICLGLLFALFLILLAVVIWLGTEYHRCRQDIDDLKAVFQHVNGQSLSSVSSPGSGSSSASTLLFPAVYLSKNATASAGYTYAGSLFRCEDHQCTSSLDVATDTVFTRLYL